MQLRAYNPTPDSQRDMKFAMHSKNYENVAIVNAYVQAMVALEPTLGPAEWICDENGAHMMFHPRAFNSSEDGDRKVKFRSEGVKLFSDFLADLSYWKEN